MRAEKTLRLARVVGAMAAENLSEVARTVEATDEFELRAPSEHSWVLMAYTYLVSACGACGRKGGQGD